MAMKSSVVFTESAERYGINLRPAAHCVSERQSVRRPDGVECKGMSVGETERGSRGQPAIW